MRNISFFFFLFLNTRILLAQKPIIDSNVYNQWSRVSEAKISPNGKYVIYWIKNEPQKSQTFVLSSTDGRWKLNLPGIKEYPSFFTNDSRKAIVKFSGDSLGIITLEKKKVEYILHVKSFKCSENANSNWLAYQLDSPNFKCIIRNLATGKSYQQDWVTDYFFCESANGILLQLNSGETPNSQTRLLWLNLLSGEIFGIWEGKDVSEIKISREGQRLIFLGTKIDDFQGYCIWQYEAGHNRASVLVSDSSIGIPKGFLLADGGLSFSEDGRTLFFRILQKQRYSILGINNSGVVVWDYKDKFLPSDKDVAAEDGEITEDCDINFDTHNVVILKAKEEQIIYFKDKQNNKYVLVSKSPFPDAYYNSEDRPSLFLQSVQDGSRKLLINHFNSSGFQSNNPILSPSEKFVLWFDVDSLAYFSYEIETGILRNLSKSVPANLYDIEAARIGRYTPFGIGAWLSSDRRLLIYGQYDIWQVDPKGIERPMNLTNNVGQSQHVVFGIIHPNVNELNEVMPFNGGLLMDGYNQDTKENGFWIMLNEHSRNSPQKCIMDQHSYWIERVGVTGVDTRKSAGRPIKAKDANVYLVRRMSCRESPNLFVTTDFKSFRALSEVYPEKKYNWMSSELISWRTLDGKISKGVLYKPENFDSTKKYPLIFNCYEWKSDQLNAYLEPDFSHDDINIPSYTSRGYLVFVPDIYFVAQKGGWSVLNSIQSAANYLISFPWVDSTKFGLQGHSFGGWETNFLLTHSHLFAAACEAAGISDYVSEYGEIQFDNIQNTHVILEIYQGPFGKGVTPWRFPTAYVENSPIFSLDSITAPLLMVHSRVDKQVPFEQAIELFTGMKRAGKKVWLLEYKGGGHSLFFNEARDYSLRMQQFFDHFLMGAPAPEWLGEK